MRYTKFAQKIADQCARDNFLEWDCFSALYAGKLDNYPETLIFIPLYQNDPPPTGMPQFILVRKFDTELVADMDILHSLMKKYEWPEEYDLEDGWTPPTQIKRFYEVKDEADRLAREWHEEHNRPYFAPMCWEVMKKILREKFHIQWKSPSEIFLQRIYN